MNEKTQEALKIDLNKVRATIIERTYLDVNSAKLIDESIKATFEACKDALEQPLIRDWKETIDERIAKDDKFKEALEQPAQEPDLIWQDGKFKRRKDLTLYGGEKFYTHPAPMQNEFARTTSWQGVSDDEIETQITIHIFGNDADEFSLDIENIRNFARAIEQALKEKNT